MRCTCTAPALHMHCTMHCTCASRCTAHAPGGDASRDVDHGNLHPAVPRAGPARSGGARRAARRARAARGAAPNVARAQADAHHERVVGAAGHRGAAGAGRHPAEQPAAALPARAADLAPAAPGAGHGGVRAGRRRSAASLALPRWQRHAPSVCRAAAPLRARARRRGACGRRSASQRGGYEQRLDGRAGGQTPRPAGLIPGNAGRRCPRREHHPLAPPRPARTPRLASPLISCAYNCNG
eukprot:scaffold79950_cov70-Phaeocystis_antarctica.AAC.1